jgi:hypothetical protein
MAVGEPDIRPTDLQFIPTALREAFPTATVTAHPRPASIATLFRVDDGPRHPRPGTDALAALIARAGDAMRRAVAARHIPDRSAAA